MSPAVTGALSASGRREAAMWASPVWGAPGLGPVNLALIAFYFVPAWGKDALRVLLSPYAGFEDRTQAAVAIYFRGVFDLGLDGAMRVSDALAAIKLVIAAGF